MMNRATRTLRIAALLTAVVAGIAATGARQRHERVAEADSRKADYIFLEGQRQNQIGNPDAYYELLRRAHELDSTDRYVGMELGYMRMRIARGDSAELAPDNAAPLPGADAASGRGHGGGGFRQLADQSRAALRFAVGFGGAERQARADDGAAPLPAGGHRGHARRRPTPC